MGSPDLLTMTVPASTHGIQEWWRRGGKYLRRLGVVYQIVMSNVSSETLTSPWRLGICEDLILLSQGYRLLMACHCFVMYARCPRSPATANPDQERATKEGAY